MDYFQGIQNLCRVCLCEREDLDANNQLTSLNPEQIDKLVYIGDCSEIVQLDNEQLQLCLICYGKLNWVYDFVVKLNSSKAKVRDYAFRCADDTNHQVVDVSTDTIDTTEDLLLDLSHTEKFIHLVRVGREVTDEAFQHSESTTKPNIPIAITDKRQSQPIIRSEANPQIDAKAKPNIQAKAKPETDAKLKIKPENERKKKLVQQPKIEPKSSVKDLLKRDSSRRGSTTKSATGTECRLCEKTFSTKSNTMRHERTHSGQRFLCRYENCNAFFTQKSSLKYHVEVKHKGYRPHTCEYCGKTFGHSSTLFSHIRVHTGESPHECEYCQRKFRVKSNLIRHFKLHRRQLPPRQEIFQCTICSKFLASKNSHACHMNWHKKRMQT